MSLTVAVQMDPVEKIRIAGDSTFALMLEAAARGHRLFYYTPDQLSMRGQQVFAEAARIEVELAEALTAAGLFVQGGH